MKKECFETKLPNGHVINYVRVRSGTCYHRETSTTVISVLETLLKEGTQVRIFYGDTKTGQSWHDEWDVVGIIGRSTGSIKIPLLVPEGEHGGSGLLDHCIIRIDSMHSTRYQHKKFRVGEMSLTKGKEKTFPWEVFIDGVLHARCKKNTEATKLMAFLQGNIFAI